MNFPCPKCQAQVPETAMSCPSCHQSFVVDMSAGPTGPAMPFGGQGGHAPTPFGGQASPMPFGGQGGHAPTPFGGQTSFGVGASTPFQGSYGAPVGLPPAPSATDVDDAGTAALLAVLSLFCFAPLAFGALYVANRSAMNAAKQGRATPKYLALARILSYLALVLWGFALVVKFVLLTKR